jgi:MFS family permease
MVAVLLLLYVLAMTDRLILTMLVAPIQQELGLSDFRMSLILGPAFAFSHALAVFPLGWATDRFARKNILSASVAFWSLATVASSLSRSFTALFAGRVGVAVGEAALLPAAYSLIADRFPKHRLTTALAVFNMGPKLGTATAFAAGAIVFSFSNKVGTLHVPLLGELSSWRLALFMIGAPGLLMALLALTFAEPIRRNLARAEQRQSGFVTFVWGNRRTLLPLLIGFSLMGVCSGALNNWVPTYLTRQFGWTPAQYGPVMSIISVVAASTIVLKGLAVDWLVTRGVPHPQVRFYTWLQAGTLPVLIVAFAASSAMLFLVLFGIVNVIVLSYLLYAGAIIQLLAPNQLRGQITAMFLFCSSVLAQGIGPSLVAALTDFVFADPMKLGTSLAIVSGAALAGSCLALRIALRSLQREPAWSVPAASVPASELR